MAETEITQMLVNLIPQGGFAGFLFYLFHNVKKELADHRTEAKKQEQEIRKQYREEKQALRDRYDVVIDSLQKEKEGYTYHHQENKYTKDDYDILALVVIPLKKVFYYRFKDIKLKYISLKGDEKQHLYRCLDNPITDEKIIKKIKRCY